MKRIAIIDTLTLTHEGRIYGHFANTAKQYKTILEHDYDVTIVGGNTYSSYFENIRKLPFITDKDDFQNGKFIKRLVLKIKVTLNVFVSIIHSYDYYIYQDGNRNIVAFLLLILSFLRRKVVLIRYTPCEHIEYKFITFSPNKIKQIITSLEDTKASYPIPSLIVPDYFPTIQSYNEHDIQYDFVILGTIVEGKDYEDIVKAISNTKYSLLIAGHFGNKNRLLELMSIKTDNITIIDKYLEQSEYDNFLNSTRYVVLPYKKELYTNKSSGVTLEALYAGKPIIAVNNRGYEWIQKQNLGILYDNSIAEVMEKIEDEGLYNSITNNIVGFIEDMKSKENDIKTLFT